MNRQNNGPLTTAVYSQHRFTGFCGVDREVGDGLEGARLAIPSRRRKAFPCLFVRQCVPFLRRTELCQINSSPERYRSTRTVRESDNLKLCIYLWKPIQPSTTSGNFMTCTCSCGRLWEVPKVQGEVSPCSVLVYLSM